MKRAIIIMAKVPSAGKVKTRLQPFLSPEQSAELAEAFLQDTVNKAKSVCEAIILAYSPAEERKILEDILPSQKVFVEQTGNNLGDKMFNAFEFAFGEKTDAVVMIGTDSPTFPADFIEQAFEFLETNSDVVLGKTEDGGFYLIGLQKNSLRKKIFENVEWSSAKTFRQTSLNIKTSGLKMSLLTDWFDVDLPADLKRLQNELKENPTIAPLTFDRLSNISFNLFNKNGEFLERNSP